MPETSDLFNIVLVGAMNPRIHHPSWYRINNLVSVEDEQSALRNRDTLCTPPVAQFRTPGLVVACQEERWEIGTTNPEYLARILDVAIRTFEVLYHTPIKAYGFNFNFLRETTVPDVGRRLAERVAALELGLQPSGVSANLAVKYSQPGRDRNVTIAPAPAGGQGVLVGNNMHYEIEIDTDGLKLFSLKPLLQEHFDADYQEARAQVDRVIQFINATFFEE